MKYKLFTNVNIYTYDRIQCFKFVAVNFQSYSSQLKKNSDELFNAE